jgi:general secretion pathway protein G
MKKQSNDKEKGFTLVELLVVIAIIGILAAIIIPNAFNAIEKSKVAAAESDYKAIKAATLNFYADTGEWPDDEGDLINSNIEGWNGPYLERWPSKNPWGGSYSFIKGSPEIYIELDSVPLKAAEKIEDDLGTEIVEIIGSGNTRNVKLIITKE